MIPHTDRKIDPPNSNRGVNRTLSGKNATFPDFKSRLKASVKIDWLAVTFHAKRNDMTKLYPDELSKDWHECIPVKGYTVAREFLDGRRENVNPQREDMGTHVIYSGQCLNRISDMTGIDGMELLRHYVTHSGKVTRLDIAVDAHESGIDLTGLKALFDDGKAITRAKECRLIEGSGLHKGLTLYIGSRTSEAFLRCYDKAAEQKMNADWKRFEMELKGSKASQIAVLLTKARNPYTLIQSIIRGHCDFDNEIYRAVMDAEPTVIARAKETGSDTRTWLLDICAPSLARQIVNQSDKHVLRQFLTIVADQIQVLESELSGTSAKWETLQQIAALRTGE